MMTKGIYHAEQPCG